MVLLYFRASNLSFEKKEKERKALYIILVSPSLLMLMSQLPLFLSPQSTLPNLMLSQSILPPPPPALVYFTSRVVEFILPTFGNFFEYSKPSCATCLNLEK